VENFLLSMGKEHSGNDAAYFKTTQKYLFKILPNAEKLSFDNNESVYRGEIYDYHNKGIINLKWQFPKLVE
jgi:hypothetical protein